MNVFKRIEEGTTTVDDSFSLRAVFAWFVGIIIGLIIFIAIVV